MLKSTTNTYSIITFYIYKTIPYSAYVPRRYVMYNKQTGLSFHYMRVMYIAMPGLHSLSQPYGTQYIDVLNRFIFGFDK